ncbi:MAG: glycosyltransferase [Chloroflexi bacterium]|nr:glycosyltransferase [Chloroflexota bacterium]
MDLVEEDGHEVLTVASSHPDLPPAALRELEALVRRSVRVVPARSEDIEFWLDVATGSSWARALMASVARVLRMAGLGESWITQGMQGPRERFGVEEVQHACHLTPDVAVEILGLAAHLPHVRLVRFGGLDESLSALLPHELARELEAIPIATGGGLLVVASPRVCTQRDLQQVESASGLRVRWCLCQAEPFARARARVFRSAPAAVPVDEQRIFRILSRTGRLAAGDRAAVASIAQVREQPALQAALELGYVTADDIAVAKAQALGIEALRSQDVAVDNNLAERLPPTLWRQWGCVPVRRLGRGSALAAPEAIAPSVLALVARMAAHEVQPVIAPQAAVDLALASLPVLHERPYTAEDHALQTGWVSEDGPAFKAAVRRSREEQLPLVEALAAADVISPDDLAEAQSVATGLPWLRLDRYAPDDHANQLLARQLAERYRRVPFRQYGLTLRLASLNGEAEPPSELAASVTPLILDPLIAAADDPDEAVARWYADPGAGAPANYREFAQYLVRQGKLSQRQLEDTWQARAQGLPFDAALQLQVGSAETPQLLARYLGLNVQSLDLQQEQHELLDAVGRLQHRTAWHDPVDHALARELPRDDAERLAALPVARDGEAIVLAVADPLNAETTTYVSQRFGDVPLEVRVTDRRGLEVAIRRVWQATTIGERLLQAGLVTPAQLERAVALHETTGVRLGEALVSSGAVDPDELARALAAQRGVPFYDVEGIVPDPALLDMCPAPVDGPPRFLPLHGDADGAIVVAAPDPLDDRELREAAAELGRPLRQVIVTAPAFDAALDLAYRDAFHDHSAEDLLARSPEESARWVLSRGQRAFFLVAIAGLAAGFAMRPVQTGVALIGASTVFYLAFAVYKFYLAYRAITHTLEVRTDADALAQIDDRELPVYTILIPLYHETEVLSLLVRAIDRIDYPKAKLDVKLLLEEDDTETIHAARKAGLPSHFKLVVVPHGQPKGKPKACNYGLIHARGEFVVIYDAEDLPEPDQLKKALAAFAVADDDRIACVQAKLNYFNRDQNLLTRWFTTEYSMWFDLFLPGLDASGAPIPLGGTSNHFRTARLRELGAWDPFNVTEDADLGVRLFKAGWKTAVMDSTTYEEANSELYNWIRQRSRWVKGYVQTYLVHMRHPLRLLRQLGPRGFLSFQMVVGGTFFCFLANPVFWALTASWFLFQWSWIRELFPAGLFYLGAISLYLGNFAFTYLNVAGCVRREYYSMVKYALLSPVYWALMSVAAWKGFVQLFYAPSYWEKTNHGLFRGIPEVATEEGAAA